MFRKLGDTVWTFDLEWVPDFDAYRKLNPEWADFNVDELLGYIWSKSNKTRCCDAGFYVTDNATKVICRNCDGDVKPPMDKLILSKPVALSALVSERDGLKLPSIISVPALDYKTGALDVMEEPAMIERFLVGIGQRKPQLVGWNSVDADLQLLIQRGIVHGISAGLFGRRPNKPWEGVDYFNRRDNDQHVDLMQIFSGGSREWRLKVSLDEACVLSGIPVTGDVHGSDVLPMWLAGRMREIVEYNQLDCVRTYLLFLRAAHFANLITTDTYHNEQASVHTMLAISNAEHLMEFEREWVKLSLTVDPAEQVG